MIGLSRITLLAVVTAAGTTLSVSAIDSRDLNSATVDARPYDSTSATLIAPANLSASSASSSAVSLAWTGAATDKIAIERKVLGGAWLVPSATAPATAERPTPSVIAIVSATSFTDSKIDAFTTYVYRARQVGANNVLSAQSNEITVGPPPVGMSTIIAAPKAMHDHDPSQFASMIRMTFDANGDPALAYITNDLNNDGELEDTDLSVITWNRAKYRWNPRVVLDTVGNVTRSGTRAPIAFARDASTGQFGLLHMIGEHDLRMSTSDDAGLTWKHTRLDHSGDEESGFSTPSLAMAGGRFYAAYAVAGKSVTYKAGMLTDAPNKWTSSTAPVPSGQESKSEGVNIALDAAGKAVVAYYVTGDSYNTVAMLWRPDGGTSVKITDTNNKQNDDPGLSMAISGSQIAIGMYAGRDEHFFANHHIWFARSNDNGATWSAPVVVEDDGANAMNAPFNITLDKAGHPAMVANTGGGNEGAVKCGQPKLMRSVDGVKWATCAPDTKGAPATSDIVVPVVAFAANDKLYVAFTNRANAAGLTAGLSLWRER